MVAERLKGIIQRAFETDEQFRLRQTESANGPYVGVVTDADLVKIQQSAGGKPSVPAVIVRNDDGRLVARIKV
jgi:hypothetical protein